MDCDHLCKWWCANDSKKSSYDEQAWQNNSQELPRRRHFGPSTIFQPFKVFFFGSPFVQQPFTAFFPTFAWLLKWCFKRFSIVTFLNNIITLEPFILPSTSTSICWSGLKYSCVSSLAWIKLIILSLNRKLKSKIVVLFKQEQPKYGAGNAAGPNKNMMATGQQGGAPGQKVAPFLSCVSSAVREWSLRDF